MKACKYANGKKLLCNGKKNCHILCKQHGEDNKLESVASAIAEATIKTIEIKNEN